MARVTTGNKLSLSGRIGDEVYVQMRGKTYLRKAVLKRNDQGNPGMALNRQRFTCITRFCAGFKQSLLPLIWNDVATTGSGYNLFLHSNSPAFAKDGALDKPWLLKFSVGALPVPEGLAAERIEADSQTIRVSWIKETHVLGTRWRDELMLVCYDGSDVSPLQATGIRRKEAGGSFVLPAMQQRVQYLYLFFGSEDRRSFSESQCFMI